MNHRSRSSGPGGSSKGVGRDEASSAPVVNIFHRRLSLEHWHLHLHGEDGRGKLSLSLPFGWFIVSCLIRAAGTIMVVSTRSPRDGRLGPAAADTPANKHKYLESQRERGSENGRPLNWIILESFGQVLSS